VGIGTSPVDESGRDAVVTGDYVERVAPADSVVRQEAGVARAASVRATWVTERLALVVTGVLVAVAILEAAVLFGGELMVIGAVGLFLYMALLGLPYWLAAAQERGEDERRRGRPA
jgi:hypothetical protein